MILGWLDGCVADTDDQEDGVCEEQRILEVFELG
jgi:hypothetical protein